MAVSLAQTGLRFPDNTIQVSAYSGISDDNSSNATRYIMFSNGSGGVYSFSIASSKLTFNPYTGGLSASRVYNAVYNDIADYFEIDNELSEIEYGKCYVRYANGDTNISSEYNQQGIVGIASDTLGFGVGKKDIGNKEIPIAIGGIVLAYVDEIYETGTPLTTSENGYLTQMDRQTVSMYPERLVATFYKEEKQELWNDIEVKGRYWVKIK